MKLKLDLTFKEQMNMVKMEKLEMFQNTQFQTLFNDSKGLIDFLNQDDSRRVFRIRDNQTYILNN